MCEKEIVFAYLINNNNLILGLFIQHQQRVIYVVHHLFWKTPGVSFVAVLTQNLPCLHVLCSIHVLSIGILQIFNKPIEILETKPSACLGVPILWLKRFAMTIKFLFFYLVVFDTYKTKGGSTQTTTKEKGRGHHREYSFFARLCKYFENCRVNSFLFCFLLWLKKMINVAPLTKKNTQIKICSKFDLECKQVFVLLVHQLNCFWIFVHSGLSSYL